MDYITDCLPRGHRFPAGQGKGGYTLMHDLRVGDPIRATTFKAYGSQEQPQPGMPLPDWLGKALEREAEKYRQPVQSETVNNPTSDINSTGDEP